VATPVAAAMDSSESQEEIEINGIDELQRVLLDKFGIDVEELTKTLGPKIDMFTEIGYLKKPDVYKEDYEWTLNWMTENGLPPEVYAFYQDMCVDTWTHLYHTWQDESTNAFRINKFDPNYQSELSKAIDANGELVVALQADVDMFNYTARHSRFSTKESFSNMIWTGEGLEDYKQAHEDLKNAIDGYEELRIRLEDEMSNSNDRDQQKYIDNPRQDYLMGTPLYSRPEGKWSDEYFWGQSDADALFKTLDGYLNCTTEYDVERMNLLRLSESAVLASEIGYTAGTVSGLAVGVALGIAVKGSVSAGWNGLGAALVGAGFASAMMTAAFFASVATHYQGKAASIEIDLIKLTDKLNVGLRTTSEKFRIITARTIIRNEWTVPGNCLDTYITCFKMELPKPVQGVNEKS
jgi:hypothetical protein